MKLCVSRNKSGTLLLWFNKPIKQGESWYSNDGFFILDEEMFPEVTFETSPQMVELKLVDVTESTIKWQTGTPKIGGEYLVCLKDGSVTTDKFLVADGLEGDWKRFNKSYVVGWCKLSNIAPYKYKED